MSRQDAINLLNAYRDAAFAEGAEKEKATPGINFKAKDFGMKCKSLAERLLKSWKELAAAETDKSEERAMAKTLDETISIAMLAYHYARPIHDALFEVVAAEICSSQAFEEIAKSNLPREGDKIGHKNRDLFIRKALERAEEMRKGIMRQPESNAFKLMVQTRLEARKAAAGKSAPKNAAQLAANAVPR